MPVAQKREVEFDEIYSPVVRYESVRLLLSIGATFDMINYHIYIGSGRSYIYGTT